jgi:hypothetical protein
VRLISGVGEAKDKPSSALRNDRTFDIGRALANKHQSNAVFAPLTRYPTNGCLSSGIFGFTSVWNVPMGLLAHEHDGVLLSLSRRLVELILE